MPNDADEIKDREGGTGLETPETPEADHAPGSNGSTETISGPSGNGRGPGHGGDVGGMTGGGGRGGGTGMGGGRGFSFRNLRTFTSFKNGVFRLYYMAMLGQMAAMNMQMTARALLVFQLAGTGTALGIMSLANAIPLLALSMFGGVMADRLQKKYVLIVGQAASAVVSFVIAMALITGLMDQGVSYSIGFLSFGSWWLLVFASLVQGTIMGLMMPARQAIIPEIVEQRDLMNAVSLNTLGMNSLRLIAPAGAGFLIHFFDFHAIYFAMTGMYASAVFFVMLMPKTGTMSSKGRGAIKDVVEGFSYVRRESVITLILVITLLITILSMPYMMLLPMFTEGVWNVGEREYGILLSVSGIGAILGSLVLASLPDKKRGAMLLISGVLLGAALIWFSFSPTYEMALIAIVFVGLGQTGRMTLANTLLQYYVAPAFRGRVMSLYMMEWGVSSFGVFFVAILADVMSPQIAVGGMAIILTVLSVVSIVAVPQIRKLD
jgi:MFS family permease